VTINEDIEKYLKKLAETLKVLANPTRIKILMLCLEKEKETGKTCF